jgi:isopenicillin-N epimerase
MSLYTATAGVLNQAMAIDRRKFLTRALAGGAMTTVVPDKIVEALLAKKIVASDSPYATSDARLTPGLLNTPEEVDRTIAEVKALAA